jgi:hypothetical protein
MNKILDNKFKKGILFFHQNWTDIINNLALIDYYLEYYDKLIVLCIIDANNLINYYIRNKKNIIIIFDNYFINYFTNNIINYLHNKYNIDTINYDILFHGHHDSERIDKYKNQFIINYKENNKCFVKSFYISYDIDYIVRIKYFNINRDINKENEIYNNFIKINGFKYILYHEIIPEKKIINFNYINLNKISNTFLDYIKVLEYSQEFHLLDSVWAAIIYILDCKYKLFQKKKIFLYAKRNFELMFIEPLLLNNWIIIK